MSITYDAPTLNADITSALVVNPALEQNQAVLNSITALLGLDDAEATTNFGQAYLDGDEVVIVQEEGVELQALVIESDEGQDLLITNDILGDAANTVKYYSFDGVGADGDVTFVATIGDPVILSGGGDDFFNLSQSAAEITILAGGGDDTVITGSADDYIAGDDGDDFIIAGAGNDSIYSGTTGEDIDIDTIDGGSGWDTVYLPGFASQLSPVEIIDEWVAYETNDTSASEWAALIQNVEFISLWEEGDIYNYDAATHTVTGDGLQNSIVVVDNETDLLIGRMYQATLNRSADSDGVEWWFSNETDVVDTAQAFISSNEFVNNWGDDLNTAEFINQIYVNSFQREADLEGSIFWWQALEGGVITRAEFVVAIVGSDEADATITNVVQVSNLI